MSHHCNETPSTVRELIEALRLVDPDSPVYETRDEVPGWFDVADGLVWLGTRKCGDVLGECRNR